MNVKNWIYRCRKCFVEQLDRLNDLTPEEINTDLGKAELKRSYAVQKTAREIINVKATAIRAMEIMDRAGIAMEEPKMLRLE